MITADYSIQLKTPVRIAEQSNSLYWIKWWFVLALITIAYAITLNVAPFVHMDELLTVDLGRIILHPNTDWSIAWISNREQPAFFLFYLGPVLEELSYQLLGQYGPRIIALAGAPAAATLMVRWLLSRGTPRAVAFILGLIFLLDPLFVQAYTLGRIDGWTIALCLVSCLLIEEAKKNAASYSFVKNRTLFAGAFTSLAFFIWPSAVFLFPLVLLSVVRLVITIKKMRPNESRTVLPVVWFALGAFVIGTILLLPVAGRLYAQLGNLIEGFKINSSVGPQYGEKTGFLSRIAPFVELLRALKFTPVLVLLALAALVRTRAAGLALTLFAAITLMLCTVVYIHRVLYLLPYFIAAVGGMFHLKRTGFSEPGLPLLKRFMLVILFVWPAVFSLGARTVLALQHRQENKGTILDQAAHAMVGPGSENVLLLNTLELYYTGREQGWKMYAPYASMGDSLSGEVLRPMLGQVDYVIALSYQVSESLVRQLKQAGLHDKGLYLPYGNLASRDDGVVSNLERVRSLYRIVPQPYGPYRLFARGARNGTAAVQ